MADKRNSIHADNSSVADQGLSSEQAADLIAKFGPNEIGEAKQNGLLKLASYFWGPIPWMIETAAILSAVVQDFADFAIILTLLFVNAVVAFWQESKADNAIALLRQKLAVTARVRRDDEWLDIPARELVPGDIVHMKSGDVIPADVDLLRGTDLSVDQSSLTGESLPVNKTEGDQAYSGSIIQNGDMTAVVTATGMGTFFGKTASLVEGAGAPSHFQQAVLKIGYALIVGTIVLVAVIMLAGWLRSDPFLETLQFVLILTIAAIPVALPAVLSVTLAVGATRLSQMGAIVSRLASVEELAGMDVLCTDKTGTLTQNRLTLGDPVLIGANDVNSIMLSAALASQVESNDPIEVAILAATKKMENEDGVSVADFRPFDPVRKFSEASIVINGVSEKVAKGAPQAILAWANASAKTIAEVTAQVDALAAAGYRALAVANRVEGKSPRMLGLLSLYDPPRDDSSATIAAIRKLGVKIKMVTGDHIAIAKQIAHRLGLGDKFATPADAFADGNEASPAEILACDGYAEVFPEHKYKIVKALQSDNLIVGMTGDGVNDAPALRQADVGVAVSGATDAARAAADLVLTEAGLNVIQHAISEARRIFERMSAYAVYRISETVRVMLFMTISILVFNFYPVTAVMIVLLALLNDFPIMMIAYDNAEAAAKPVRWNMQRVLVLSGVLGTLGLISSFSLFWIAESIWHLPRPTIQTLVFLKLLVAGHLTIYLTRNDGHFWSRPWPSLKLFLTTEFTQVVGTLAAVYGLFVEPIGWKLALLVWGYALIWFLINNVVKRVVLNLLVRLNHEKPSDNGVLLKT